MKDLAGQVAVSEALNPTLGVTEQVLAVHKLVQKDNAPAILLVEENSEVGAFFIYFGIVNEPYYFVVVVKQEDERLIASASYVEAAVRVYLGISSILLDPIAITERIKLIPTESYRIGEARLPRMRQLRFKENRWYFEPQKDTPGTLEDKLKFLLDRLEPVQSKIAALQDECEIYINICYEGYKNWMGGWHIDKATIRRIAALGAEVDLDLYAFGENSLPS